MKRLSIAIHVFAFAAAIAIHIIWEISLGAAFLIFFVAWPLGGTFITIDDDFKGGWSNPDGTVRPVWLESPYWGQIAAGLALSSGGFAIDSDWLSRAGAQYWLVAAALGFLAAALITRRWWLSLGLVLGIALAWGVRMADFV